MATQRATLTQEIPAVVLHTGELAARRPLPVPESAEAVTGGLFGSVAVKLIIAFIGVFVTGMTVVLGQARVTGDDLTASLNEILNPPAGCSMPCWQGIQPNATPAEEAAALLNAMPYVRDVQVSPNMISWWWTDDRPAVYQQTGRSFDGRMELAMVNGTLRVTSIVLATNLQVGQLELALGTPDALTLHTARAESERQGSGIVHVAHYGDMSAFNVLHCPMSVDDFWAASVFIAFGQPNLAFNGETHEVTELPNWFFRDNAPGCGA
jgi:hypothetical protein